MDEKVSVVIKWSGNEYNVELNGSDSVENLRNEIHKKTGVRPHRQKLLNLKYKGRKDGLSKPT